MRRKGFGVLFILLFTISLPFFAPDESTAMTIRPNQVSLSEPALLSHGFLRDQFISVPSTKISPNCSLTVSAVHHYFYLFDSLFPVILLLFLFAYPFITGCAIRQVWFIHHNHGKKRWQSSLNPLIHFI